MLWHTTITAYFHGKQLQLLAFPVGRYTALQSQKAVTAYFSSEQLLPFDFVEQYSGRDAVWEIIIIKPLWLMCTIIVR